MSDLIRREDVVKAMNEALAVGDISRAIANDILNNILSAEPERTAKVTDTWKVAGFDELNAWCPECEHRITRGCSYCPTCGVKLEWK